MSSIETVAFVLGVINIVLLVKRSIWNYPFALAMVALYARVFFAAKLYSDALLQIFFATVAAWGWWQWLRGKSPDGSALHVARLSRAGWVRTLVASALLWPLTGFFLFAFTDTDVPWWDAFPTALSLVGQFLLGRKYVENWLAWIVVNAVSVALFAYKGLWLTVVLYAVFIALSVVGWRQWRARL